MQWFRTSYVDLAQNTIIHAYVHVHVCDFTHKRAHTHMYTHTHTHIHAHTLTPTPPTHTLTCMCISVACFYWPQLASDDLHRSPPTVSWQQPLCCHGNWANRSSGKTKWTCVLFYTLALMRIKISWISFRLGVDLMYRRSQTLSAHLTGHAYHPVSPHRAQKSQELLVIRAFRHCPDFTWSR